MNRRTFVRTMMTTGLAGMVVLTLPVIPASASLFPSRGYLKSKTLSRSFQGTIDGRLLESDTGKTWQQAFNFGSHVSVLDLVERQGVLYLELGIQQYSFYLKSQDGYTWLTTPSIPAA